MATTRKNKFKKRVKNFLVFYAIVCFLFIASYTLSRYVETIKGAAGIDIAKFNVSVNDINVKEGTPLQFDISDSKNFANKKIAPNGKGYFEFTINPDGTEVSLEFEIKFMLNEIDNDFQLTHYTINDNNDTPYDITDENIVKNNLLLPTNEHGFSDSDKINIKVYWSWDEKEEILNPLENIYDNKNMDILVIVKQKIN